VLFGSRITSEGVGSLAAAQLVTPGAVVPFGSSFGPFQAVVDRRGRIWGVFEQELTSGVFTPFIGEFGQMGGEPLDVLPWPWGAVGPQALLNEPCVTYDRDRNLVAVCGTNGTTFSYLLFTP
jgi:hypothetical protein